MKTIMDSIKRIPEDLHSPALTFGESVLGDVEAVAADDVTTKPAPINIRLQSAKLRPVLSRGVSPCDSM